MQESGYRGHKIVSAIGCFIPYILISKPSIDVEGIILIAAISIACIIFHSTVYSGYPVLNQKMKLLAVMLASFLGAFSILTRFSFIPSSIFILVLVTSGVTWGFYAVYRRSLLIRITRRSSKDAVNGAA